MRGLVHAEKPPPSIWHSKVLPPSLLEKVNVALDDPEIEAGAESMVVLGAVVSIVQV